MTAVFDSPEYECDVILKGGITSGIVYPPAIAELAQYHRFRGIAGASAGAIGASAAAAAEVGRQSETGGFGLLDSLPTELSATDDQGRTKLLRLFQPQDETRPIFDIVWQARSTVGMTRVRGILKGLFREGPRWLFWVLVAIAFLLGIAGIVVGIGAGGAPSLGLSVPLAIVLVLLVLIVGGGFVLVRGGLAMWNETRAALSNNFHGFVNGSTPDDSDDPALTDWLYDGLQRLAGRGDGSQAKLTSVPVTHGEVAGAGAQFVAITTNLSRGTSEQMPFRKRIWAFDPEEFSRIFPADVVHHMVQHADTATDADVVEALGSQLRLLPLPEHLPIIVTARMSLSFPVLLSAVPLYGLTPQRVDGGWRKKFVRNWFSDGGITSNLPVHLFDRPLPNYPTYAINLGSSPDVATDPCDNVFRPIKAGQGRLPSTLEISSTLDLLGAVFDTMQNWSDNNLIHTAGFRERICMIRLGTGEGGMNLDMSPELIAPLIERGRCAGRNLSSMRTGDLTDTGIPASKEASRQWDRHRWTRFRITGAGLGRLVGEVQPAISPSATDGTANYLDLGDEVVHDQSAFPYASDWTEARNSEVAAMWQSVLKLGGYAPKSFGDGPPGVGLSFGASSDTVHVKSAHPGDDEGAS